MRQGFVRGISVTLGESPVEISAQRLGCQKAPAEKGHNTGALVRGPGEVCPPDIEWAKDLRGASVCPRGVPTPTVPKNSVPRSGATKAPGPRNGWAIALVGYSLGGGEGKVCPVDSEWGEALREASLYPRRVAGIAAPKNSAPRSGVKKAQGP